MPRAILTDALYQALQQSRYRLNYELQIDAPSGTITVSDHPWLGRNIVLSWGEIAPLLVEDDHAPEAQSFTVRLANGVVDGHRITEDLHADRATIRGVEARLYACDVGTTSTSTIKRRLIFKGRVQSVGAATQRAISITIDGEGAYLARTLSKLVRDSYPQAPPSVATAAQPIVYGRLTDWPAIPIDVGVSAELELAIGPSDATITIKDGVARFPSSGVIQLGGYELASYSGKDEDVGTLTGLVRGLYDTPVSNHPAGSVVTQRPTTFRFLLINPDYGKLKRVLKVRIGGRELSSSRWSVDRTTGVLTIQPFNRTLGRPTYNRIQLLNRGYHLRGSPIHATSNSTPAIEPTGIRVSSDSIQTRPVTNCSHNAIPAWQAASGDYYWPQYTDTTPSSGDKVGGTPTVKLMANVAKTWPASAFETYVPPDALLVKSGVSVSLSVLPAMRRVRETETNYLLKPEIVKLWRIEATVNGVVKTWYPSGDDCFSSPKWGLALVAAEAREAAFPVQDILFEWSAAEAPPENGPYDVTLKAVCDPAIVGHACRVRTLIQSIDGVLPWTAVTGVQQATLSTENPTSDVVTLTFASTYENAILAVAFRSACDVIRIDLGGGRIVHFSPHSLEDSLPGQGLVASLGGGYMTVTVLVQNPSPTIKIQARDFQRDAFPPLPVGSSNFIMVGGATLTGLSSGTDRYPLLKDELADSAFALTFGPYPTVDMEGYEDRNTTALIEHPCDVVKHWLTEVMVRPAASVSVEEDRGLWPSYYRLAGAVVHQSDDVRAVLVRMARCSRARVFWDAFQGQWRMRYRKSPATLIAGAADHSWALADIHKGEVSLEPISDEDLITKVNLRYMRDWSLEEALESYALTAEAGSGTRVADDRYAMDFVRNKQQAQDLATFHAAWDTAATRRVGLVVRVAHLHADVLDVVSLSLPIAGSDPVEYLQGVEAQKFLVTAVGFTPHDQGLPSRIPVLLMEIPS